MTLGYGLVWKSQVGKIPHWGQELFQAHWGRPPRTQGLPKACPRPETVPESSARQPQRDLLEMTPEICPKPWLPHPSSSSSHSPTSVSYTQSISHQRQFLISSPRTTSKITIQKNTPTHLAHRAWSHSPRRGFISALQLIAEEKEMIFYTKMLPHAYPTSPYLGALCKSNVGITIWMHVGVRKTSQELRGSKANSTWQPQPWRLPSLID